MHRKHHKIHYVGGLISLVSLTILFYVTTIEARKNAIYYSSIEVELLPTNTSIDPVAMPETTYVFQGRDETSKLDSFKSYCKQFKKPSSCLIKLPLPEKCPV